MTVTLSARSAKVRFIVVLLEQYEQTNKLANFMLCGGDASLARRLG